MAIAIKAHFDGNVIVPDEPVVDVPRNEPLEIIVLANAPSTDGGMIADRLNRLRRASGRIDGPALPTEALRREHLYEERL